MIILAHRGLWRVESEKNSLAALRDALAQGFGVETDLRDRDGRVVISHDPPTGGEPGFDELLALYSEVRSGGILALNVKADGLQEQIKSSLARFRIEPTQYFLFDMAPPDALGYLRLEMPCFTRQSEIEPSPAFINRAAGIWLDCFFEDWINRQAILAHCDAGRRVALVSPELHRRDKSAAWACWREIDQVLRRQGRDGLMMLCTDHPVEARAYFDAED
jgi:hypothetical protein